jgi:hypothetical protein
MIVFFDVSTLLNPYYFLWIFLSTDDRVVVHHNKYHYSCIRCNTFSEYLVPLKKIEVPSKELILFPISEIQIICFAIFVSGKTFSTKSKSCSD